jgi:hypothetical protein
MRTKSSESATRPKTRKPRATTVRRRAVAAEIREELKPVPAMKIHFEHQSDTSRHWEGEVPTMRMVGSSIRGPQDREVATYLAGTFRTAADRFKWVDIQSPVRVEVQNDGGAATFVGVFDNLRLADGVLRAANDPLNYVARFEQPTRSWRLRHDLSLWNTLVFSPVEEQAET